MILGLDIGTKRTGVAIAEGLMAREYGTLNSREGELATQVGEICKREGVQQLVVGYPVLEDGTPSVQADYVKTQAELIEAATDIPIAYENEVLTTVEAKRILAAAGLDPVAIESRIDQMAARLILQQYLDNHQEEI